MRICIGLRAPFGHTCPIKVQNPRRMSLDFENFDFFPRLRAGKLCEASEIHDFGDRFFGGKKPFLFFRVLLSVRML